MRVYLYLCIYIYICIHTYIYINMYMYIYIYTLSLSRLCVLFDSVGRVIFCLAELGHCLYSPSHIFSSRSSIHLDVGPVLIWRRWSMPLRRRALMSQVASLLIKWFSVMIIIKIYSVHLFQRWKFECIFSQETLTYSFMYILVWYDMQLHCSWSTCEYCSRCCGCKSQSFA